MAARLRLSSPGSLFDGSSLDAEDDRRTAARSPLMTRPHVWGSFFMLYGSFAILVMRIACFRPHVWGSFLWLDIPTHYKLIFSTVFVPMFGDLFLWNVSPQKRGTPPRFRPHVWGSFFMQKQLDTIMAALAAFSSPCLGIFFYVPRYCQFSEDVRLFSSPCLGIFF